MKLSKIKFIKLYYLLILSLVSFNLVVFPQTYDPVLLDPGHGDFDGGASGSCGIIEKTFVLDISNEVYDLIENDFNCPWTAYTTRHTDIFLTPEERVEMANNPLMNQFDSRGYEIPDDGVVLFVSIHANSGVSTAHGTEVFYYEGSDERSRRSKNVAVLNLQYYLDQTS